MINVLPPTAKSEIKYAKFNSRLLRYITLAGVTAIALTGLMWLSFGYANRQISQYQATIATRQQQVNQYQDTEAKIEQLQSNLKLIDSLLNERTKYSALLDDLAAVLPANSYINEMQLLGDDQKPMEIIITTDSFNKAAEVRNGLIQSERIKSADIQSVTRNEEDKLFKVVLVVAFEPGAAR